MRLFVAINFDEQTKEQMLAVQHRLRQLGWGNFSRPENLHLTLAFLGEVAPQNVAAVRRAMDQVSVPALRLTFDHVGRFRRDGSDLWWIGIAPNRELLALQKELSRRLQEQGFSLDSREFSPHITLARQVVLKEEPDRNGLLAEPFSACSDTVSLMLSERINGRLTYTQLYAIRARRDN